MTSGFQQWLKGVFNRPSNEIAAQREPNDRRFDSADLIHWLTCLFCSGNDILQDYSPHQINNGLWYIVSSGMSGYIDPIFDNRLLWHVREPCVQAMSTFFRGFFANRCDDCRSHCIKLETINPINEICYMWWDVLGYYGDKSNSESEELDTALINVLREILRVQCVACQESAIHGLGHWQSEYPTEVKTVLEKYLCNENLAINLRRYAKNAKVGGVQ